MILLNSFLGILILTGPASTAQANYLPTMQQIVEGMKSHEEVQERRLIEYQMRRTFHAENRRFKLEATLDVMTTFRRPDLMESEVVRSEGSKLIREKVFDKILEAERETQTRSARQQIRITPENYKLELVAKEDCAGRGCYKLKIVPREKDKFSIEGHIWVDAEEWAIVRVLGSPGKRPSFWTRHTEIARRYKRVQGIWLCETMESTSDIFLGGRSTLKVAYSYLAVHTETGQE